MPAGNWFQFIAWNGRMFVHELRKITKPSVTTVGVPTEIRTGHLPNISRKRCRLNQAVAYRKKKGFVNVERRWISGSSVLRHLGRSFPEAWQVQPSESMPAGDIDTVMPAISIPTLSHVFVLCTAALFILFVRHLRVRHKHTTQHVLKPQTCLAWR
jgi:hypothetical protein